MPCASAALRPRQAGNSGEAPSSCKQNCVQYEQHLLWSLHRTLFINHAYLGDVHGHQAAVAVVHQQVRRQGSRREVVHAAGAVRHVAHDNCVLHGRVAARQTREVTVVWCGVFTASAGLDGHLAGATAASMRIQGRSDAGR